MNNIFPALLQKGNHFRPPPANDEGHYGLGTHTKDMGAGKGNLYSKSEQKDPFSLFPEFFKPIFLAIVFPSRDETFETIPANLFSC